MFRIELQQNMVHGGVAADGDIFDISFRKTKIGFALFRHFNVFIRSFFTLFLFYLFPGWMGGGHSLLDQRIERFDDIIAHLFKAAFVHHVIGDATHHIFTIFALVIHHGDGVEHFHGG